MAKSTQERSAKAAKKREQYDEKELRHRVRVGIHQAMDRIRERSGTEEISEVMQLAILKMDAMTDAELIEFLTPPRHGFEVTKTWREEFDNKSRREALRTHSDDGECEVIEPSRLPHGN
jgi:hypothetical protein